MDDKTMLDLAARAAGIALREWDEDDYGAKFFWLSADEKWSPLENDGDALRLAIRCGLSITPYPIYAHPKHSVLVKLHRLTDRLRDDDQEPRIETMAVYDDDPCAATRRAIVRAAAEIGKGMGVGE